MVEYERIIYAQKIGKVISEFEKSKKKVLRYFSIINWPVSVSLHTLIMISFYYRVFMGKKTNMQGVSKCS